MHQWVTSYCTHAILFPSPVLPILTANTQFQLTTVPFRTAVLFSKHSLPKKSYDVDHVKSAYSRPSKKPDLWISQPTSFVYPEFIEVTWDQTVNISRIDLFFDPSFGYQTPPFPTSGSILTPISLIKDYNLYYTSSSGKSTLIEKVTNNYSSHRYHLFDLVDVQSLEVEIISTHGLNRAQVFKIAAYE